MKTLDELIQFILRHDHVVVFGNLGRNPQVIIDSLATDPGLNVAIVSKYFWCDPTEDNRIRVVKPELPVDSCDLFIVMEPTPFEEIQKPPKASRIVIFTSHFAYKTKKETVWTNVCYFHTDIYGIPDKIKHTQELLKLQDHSIQTQNVNQIFVESMNKFIISGTPDTPLDTSNTYIIIDLIRYEVPYIMFLAFLNSFDYMLANKDKVKRWVICFNQRTGRKGFDEFILHCLDKLFCKNFEHGNVTETGKILALLPYYKSGSVDRSFVIPKFRFGDVEYISPSTTLEACKAATMYNLDHWVGNIYRIKD
ncbi:hypothetical protein AVEN_257714-1 [Araneus ventricosus]|uniref:Uncharacterized protein n=1 Tax=Araneus ventricosus TaxID=182803 RepID=A0A4Y2LEL8_ARAVE|nr:hypothetical protein AVEN_257714-1 [Araneus ventricosus]